MPVSAKSPLRRASSVVATRVPLGAAGMRTSTSSSSGPAVVVKKVTKNSLAGTVRSPLGPRSTISASSATATAGSSADGSWCTRLPPSVPR